MKQFDQLQNIDLNKRIEFQKFISNQILENMIELNHNEYITFMK